jgi:eukaryotic-like serine/threonine-protein kinase
MTTITVLTLSVALHTNTIIHQQDAFAQTTDNTFERYENPTYGINIQYPSNWRIDEGDVYADDYVTDIVSFIAPIRSNTEAYAPSLYISIDNPPPNLKENLNEYLTRITREYSDTYEDFNVIESDTNSILSGYPAYEIVFTDEDGIDYKSMEVGTIIGDKVYYVTYYAEEEQYSDYLPTIQKMISSLEMTRSGGGLETNTPPPTTDGSDKINPPRNQLTDRYYECLDWKG